MLKEESKKVKRAAVLVAVVVALTRCPLVFAVAALPDRDNNPSLPEEELAGLAWLEYVTGPLAESEENAWWARGKPQYSIFSKRYNIAFSGYAAAAIGQRGDASVRVRVGRILGHCIERMLDPDGLFYHGPGAPYVWGRGNGWMAAGMAMLLKHLLVDDLNRPKILEGYRRMMATLLQHQRPDGLWGQLVDDPEIWPETSGSAMFAYAFIEGVKRGWLDGDTYAPAARKAFLALTDYIEPHGDLREVCCGTNVGTSREHYEKRPRLVGDLHGQAPLLWCCAALAD